MSADHRRSARRGRAAHGAGRGAWIGIQIVAGLMSLAVVLGSGVAWALYRNLQSSLHTIALPPGPADPRLDIDGKDQNILIVGDDSREGATPEELDELSTEENAGENTDTIMLLHVPADGSTATVISFPRDSYVQIPGHGMDKINAAYAYGKDGAGGSDQAGAALLGQVIENITGLHTDHFVKVSLLGFLRISNAIGGVDVCLNAAQNASTDKDDYGSGYSGIDLKAGWNYDVEGKQAVAFVRQRHGLPNGDIDRIHRQQYFLAAAFRKISSAGTLLNPFQVKKLVDAVSTSMIVDSELDLLTFAQQMSNLSAGNLTFVKIPSDDGSYITPTLSAVTLYTAAIPGFIGQVIGPTAAYSKAAAAAPGSVSVAVVNDTTADGAAERNVARLQALGFAAGAQASPDVTDTTTIQYPAGMEAQAKAVAAHVPGVVVVQSPTVAGVTLTLGDDGHEVPDPAAPSGPPTAGTGSTAPGSTTAPPSAGGSGSAPGDGSGSSVPDPSLRTANTADCID